MNPQMMQFGAGGPPVPGIQAQQPLPAQMQAMSLNQQPADPYRRPPVANGNPPGAVSPLPQTNGPVLSGTQPMFRPPVSLQGHQQQPLVNTQTQPYPHGVKPGLTQQYSPMSQQEPLTNAQPAQPLFSPKPQSNLPIGALQTNQPTSPYNAQPNLQLQPGQGATQQNYPSNAAPGYSPRPSGPPGGPLQQPGFGSAGGITPQQAGYSPQSGPPPQHGVLSQSAQPHQKSVFSPQPGIPPPQQPGFPASSPGGVALQQPMYSPQPGPPTQQSNFPPQPGSATQQSNFPPQPGPPTQQSNFPPQPGPPTQQSNFSPQPGPPTQQSNFPPQPGPPHQRPGYPPQPGGPPPQQPSYPPQSGPPPGGLSPQQAGYPPQPGSQPGYPPQQEGYYPPQPGAIPPHSGYASPGAAPMPGQYGPPQPKQQYPQESRRIEPDQLPSVIQVVQDDEKAHGGIFCTNQKGLVPPLMTTNFIVQDAGHCSPRFVRSTLYSVPISTDMMKQTAVPFALSISPLARLANGEHPPPLVDMGQSGPVRCIRCKAYMCPFMQFIDGGRKFQCLLCKATTDVPEEYFQHLDHQGLRTDRFERPELVLGAYEFVATAEYCREGKQPKPPALVFVIDVSYNNVRNGLVHLLCARMKEVLKAVGRVRVGFITYNSSVHFYNVKSCLASPQMVIVGDVHEIFMPILDGFLVDPVESEAVIDQLMEEIPRQFADTRETETILLPAIQAGLEALKAAECAGKLLVFHSSLPIAEAPGKLKNRDDRKLLGGEKEKTVLAPQTRVFNELGQSCVEVGVGVDLFVFNNSYIDLATIGQVSRLTGGEIFKYTYFQSDLDGDRFIEDLKMDVSRETAFDAIMRVRTSTGTRPTEFYGHIFMNNTTDIELACIDSDKAVAVEIKHDDKLTEEDGVYIQVALLYTHTSGQRRLRVLNLGLKACSQMADMYRSADLDTLINYFAKQGVTKLLEGTPKQVKENLMTRCATTLACYRKNCASPSGMGQLILPECMKLLPLYVNTLMKSDALAGGPDMTLDDRSFAMYAVTIMDVNVSLVYFYPRLVPLHLDSAPSPIRCSMERLKDDGIYLLDNGIYMFLWLGSKARSDQISELFGVPTQAQVDSEKTYLPELDTQFSYQVRDLIAHTRIMRHRHMRLTVVKQRDKLELVMRHFMMEDSGSDGAPSYVDFLCHMHKEIRTLLS